MSDLTKYHPAHIRLQTMTSEQLHDENAALASWQCIHHDGKTGLTHDERGNASCAKDAEIDRLRAEVEALQAEWTRKMAALESQSDADPTAPIIAPVQQAEPVAWREHVEQRLRAWKQPHINRSGDQLALDDFMGAGDIESLIDYVCDEWVDPPPAAPARQAEPVAYLNTKYCSLHHAESCVSVAMDRGELMPLYRHPPAAEVQRLVEAAEHLIERCNTSDDCQYGTLSTKYVRDILRAALEGVKP